MAIMLGYEFSSSITLDYEFFMQIVSRKLWKNKIKNALSLTKLMDANDPKFQQIKELLFCPIGFRMRKLRCSMWQIL